MQCSNCKTTLGCGCQVRKASNGASVCNNCISAYEASLNKPVPPQIPFNPNRGTEPSNISVSYTPKA